MMVNEVEVYLPDLECQQATANGNPDVMRWHEAMRQPDKHEFVKAADDEIQAHIDNGLWEIVPRHKVPQRKTYLPWSLGNDNKKTKNWFASSLQMEITISV